MLMVTCATRILCSIQIKIYYMNSKQVMNHAADNCRILATSMVEKANLTPGGHGVNIHRCCAESADPQNPKWEGQRPASS